MAAQGAGRCPERCKLKHFEEGGRRLKKRVADLSLDQAQAAGRAAKNNGEARAAAVVEQLRVAFALSERRACRLPRFSRASQRYESIAEGTTALRRRIDHRR